MNINLTSSDLCKASAIVSSYIRKEKESLYGIDENYEKELKELEDKLFKAAHIIAHETVIKGKEVKP